MMPLLAFDLDGTLLDCRPRQVELAADLLRERCLPPLDEVRFWAIKRSGATTRLALQALLPDRATADAIAADWHDRIESAAWLELDQPLPGVVACLDDLLEKGFELSMLTARTNRQGVDATIDRLGWRHIFSRIKVVAAESASSQKATVLSHWKPIAFVGDTESDAVAASLAGVPFVGLSTGQRDATWLAEQGVRQCFPNLNTAITHALQTHHLTTDTGDSIAPPT